MARHQGLTVPSQPPCNLWRGFMRLSAPQLVSCPCVCRMQELWLFKIGRNLIGWSLRPSSNSAQRFIVFKLQVGKHTESGITFARQSEFIGFPLELYVVISNEIHVTDSENKEVMKDEGGRWAKDRGFL